MPNNAHKGVPQPPDSNRLEELRRRGQTIYEQQLKAIVEPERNGEYIVIHVDSEDYTVARSTAEATRVMLKRHPVDGRLYTRKIGSEPEYGLAARILAGERRVYRGHRL